MLDLLPYVFFFLNDFKTLNAYVLSGSLCAFELYF
jgi:hypothetical protein